MKRLIYIPVLLALLTGFASCQRDEELLMDEDVERTDDLPIQLEISIGDALSTRSKEQAKRFFSAGNPETGEKADIIHVEATFHLVGDNGESTQKRYSALEFTEEGKWVVKGGNNFAWPNTAVSGDFKAYYIHGSTGALSSNEGGGTTSTTMQTLFTDIVDGRDPLRADTIGFRYGHTVGLRFEHILTHLTIIELDAGVDENLIFEGKPDKFEEQETPDAGQNSGTLKEVDFKNAFNVSLVTGSDGPEIKFEFLNVQDEEWKANAQGVANKTVVKAPTELVRDRQSGKESREVGFFLEPDCVFNKFNIYFSNGDQYIQYENSDPNAKEVLKGNNRYTFDVKRSAGVIITKKPEQQWDESDEFTEIVDAEGFLTAISTNSEYIEDEKRILEATTNPAGTRLLCNVYFRDPYYHVFPHDADPENGKPNAYDFVPAVTGENIFDGGYHYIKDMYCPLFYSNGGTIKNLGLLDVKIGEKNDNVKSPGPWTSVEKYDQNGEAKGVHDYSSVGAIATKNNGKVQNIRIKNLSMTVEVLTTRNGEEASREAHAIGALFGINEGSSAYVEQIYLSGEINIKVQNADGTPAIPTVNIGGLVGQNSATIINIGQLVDDTSTKEEYKSKPATISVTNSLNGGLGAYSIGGLVGNNTGKLSEISIPTTKSDTNGPAVTVDSSRSSGVTSYIGGLVGIADSSSGNEISSCLIGSGSVTAGTTAVSGSINAYSFTGGLVGVINERTHIFNCTAFCSVNGSTGKDNVSRAAGGAFGEIKEIQLGQTFEPGKWGPLAVFGEKLTGEGAGCFAGIAPSGKSWTSDYQNIADVKKFDGVKYVGNGNE